MIISYSLGSGIGRAVEFDPSEFPPGWPLKQLKGLADVRDSKTEVISNPGGPGLSNRRILDELQNHPVSREQEQREENAYDRDSE